MSGVGDLEHCKPLFIDLKIQTVINLYFFDSVKYIFENQNLIKPNSDNHSYNTRNKDSAIINFNRLSKTLNSHLVTTLKVYNHLLPLVQKYEEKTFLNKYYLWLLNNPFYSLTDFFSTNCILF